MTGQDFGADELAGHNLLLALGLEASAQNLETAARHMRMHREGTEGFLLDKAQEALQQSLEQAFLRRIGSHDGVWAAGYGAAEQDALGWFLDQQTNLKTTAPMSKGRFLRSLVRAAKRDNAIVTKRPG